MEKGLENLLDALEEYVETWERERKNLHTEEQIKYHVKLTSQIYLGKWIINSINGGLEKPHATNICNILWADRK